MKCNRCSKESKAFLSYGPHRFCREHFLEFFEKRVKKTVRKNDLYKRKEHLTIGYSGGKDSTVALYLMNKFFGKGNKITALLLDEGIKGYRDKALHTARNNCEEWGIPFKAISFKERFGVNMVEVMKELKKHKGLGGSCSFCGPMRRKLLNQGAKELKADKLVTGHNLDDEVQSILMNFFDNDWKRMSRLGPISGKGKSKGFVPRIKPLYECPEKEIIAYANFLGLKYYGEECCPFSWQAKRNEFRSMLDKMEERFPGTKYSILNSFLEVRPLLEKRFGKGVPGACVECGTPASGKLCGACRKLGKLSLAKTKDF